MNKSLRNKLNCHLMMAQMSVPWVEIRMRRAMLRKRMPSSQILSFSRSMGSPWPQWMIGLPIRLSKIISTYLNWSKIKQLLLTLPLPTEIKACLMPWKSISLQKFHSKKNMRDFKRKRKKLTPTRRKRKRIKRRREQSVPLILNPCSWMPLSVGCLTNMISCQLLCTLNSKREENLSMMLG